MLVRAEGLQARYGRALALSDLSFDLKEGEILSILGPNGSGKTTLFRVLLGLLEPSAGTIEVLGARPGARECLARIRATIEIPSLYGHLSALENLEITARLKGRRDETRAALDALLGEVGLPDVKRAPVVTFSLGMRQRLALAEALIGRPRLLILDEPTNGLDPEGIRWFREWIVQAVRARGLSVILSSHILSEVALVSDRLIVLKNGRARFAGTVADLKGSSETSLRVRTRDLESTAGLLREHGFHVARKGDDLHLEVPAERTPEVARALVRADHDILDLGMLETSLEDRYLALMEAQ